MTLVTELSSACKNYDGVWHQVAGGGQLQAWLAKCTACDAIVRQGVLCSVVDCVFKNPAIPGTCVYIADPITVRPDALVSHRLLRAGSSAVPSWFRTDCRTE